MNLMLALWGFASSGGTPPVYNLDGFTASVFGIYGIDRLISTYTGHAINVRRDSDNATQDIDFLSGGALDTTSLATFVGSGSGYITKVYDQSGGGNDFAQATTTTQPRIVNAGTYDAKMVFDGTDDTMVCVNTHGTPTGVSMYLGGTRRSTAARQIFMSSDSGNAGATSGDAVVLWDWDVTSTDYRNIVASDTGANLVIGRAPSASLSTNVNAITVDLTQSADADRAPYYSGGTLSPSMLYNDVGTVPTTATLDNLEPYNIGARGGANPSAIDVFNFVIYETAHTSSTVLSISTVLTHFV